MPPVYRLNGVRKTRLSDGTGFCLVVPELVIERGEKVALVGESGCGKSTLLDLMALVLRPDGDGLFSFQPPDEAVLDVQEMWQQQDRDLMSTMRQRYMGYVTQTGGLLPYLTVRENIALPRALSALPEDGTVTELAEALGIDRHLRKKPAHLSVGERQRVAIARALSHRPAVVIADEPTASLDPITARTVMTLFTRLVDRFHMTLILASHDWHTVEALGLRRLTPHTQQKRDGTMVASLFHEAGGSPHAG